MNPVPAQSLIGDLYPQRRGLDELPWIDRATERIRLTLEAKVSANPARMKRFLTRVEREGASLDTLPHEAVSQLLSDLRRQLRRHGLADPHVARCFALVRRRAGEILGMRHFPAQIRGGYHLLHGRVVEMDTGEGKTLMATLPAITVALAGMAVHVVTVNDYLATRDAQLMEPLYAAFGLTTGLVLEGTKTEEKIREYRANIVYCTNKTLVFDYLRDRITLGRHMQPLVMAVDRLTGRMRDNILLHGLQFAIVDEADSVFIDEARTPLIISAEQRDPGAEHFYAEAIELARQFVAGEDFELEGRVPHLTDAGRSRLQELRQGRSGLWSGHMRSQEAIRQALWALHGFQRDVHYIVREHQDVAKVMIVDENTGRVMPDRSWERGLQQLIELKEGVAVSPEKEVLARISYQLFFRRYLRLSGMTGTCREVARELVDVYGVGVVRIHPQRPSRRKLLPIRIFATAEQRWQAVLEAIIQRRDGGQAVLVGTRTVASSEALSARLTAAGIAHRVLNAKQDKTEAETIQGAGMGPRVTIATNMAGRGTDIQPDASVLAAGGLHVILTEGHDNARVDRQMIGRCARQGDPGSAQYLLSLEDELVAGVLSPLRRILAPMLGRWPESPILQAMARDVYRFAQWRTERNHRRIRRRQLNFDFQMRHTLSFSGTME
ncbi:MAG: preprotein translocase subunit SecA [Magnetococcales bacterium]|nr:preprotein translocase subunit SecA [Magnetococcales bacterium]MBF0629939.1 preprotein translocase subunit SecA [Magnetococcales bacterium]